MTRNIVILLASAAAVPAYAQTPPQQPSELPSAASERNAAPVSEADEESDEEAIVVVGQRERATVIGDIPPENQLNSRDIRATGATSISELLEAIAPPIGSARGRGSGQPVLLRTACAFPVFANFATFRPKQSSGSTSFPRKSR